VSLPPLVLAICYCTYFKADEYDDDDAVWQESGTVRTLVSLDREAPDATVAVDYVLTVTDAGSPLALTSSAALRLSVADVDDNVPVFAVPTYQFTVCIEVCTGMGF